jgi:hypothetical protein
VQLDQTRIVIRPRSIGELLDLAFRVAREFWRPLLVANLFLVLPFFLLNAWIAHPLLASELTDFSIARFVRLMAAMVFLEMPLATAPTTLVLGRGMFLEPTDFPYVRDDLRQHAMRLVFLQGIKRMALAWIYFWSLLDPSSEFSPAEFILPLLAIAMGLLRFVRPFLNEIILLERTPWRGTGLTIRKRSQLLHAPNGGELFARGVLTSIASALVAACVTFSLWFFLGALTSQWQWGSLMLEVVYPASLWIAAVYFAIVNYLSYLDLRIRREGWEVELKLRAAALDLRENAA